MANSRSGESVIQRVARIIAAFDEAHPRLTISQISRRAEVPESTAHRIVADLVTEGLLSRHGSEIQIGNRLWAHVSRLSPTLSLRDAAMGYLSDIQAVVGHHTVLSVLDGDKALYIERLGARNSTVSIANLGTGLHWHGVSAGWVLVAHLPQEEQERRLAGRLERFTEYTVTDPDELRRRLAQARREGFAASSGISVPTSSGVSVPIRDGSGDVVAALGVIVPRGEERLRTVVPLLLGSARGISRSLGWAPQEDGPLRVSKVLHTE